MWATIVNRDGIVCAVAFTGQGRGDQWPGSRVISAQKADTGNAFSLPGLALSTANLYSAVQPGGSLYGLQHSNPVNTDVAYGGSPANYGTASDPMVLGHIGLVGDTYTITVIGEQTAGRFCVIDMHIPPGGGPPPHRHDFEETFVLLEGQMEATFRGTKSTLHAGETLNIPANAPHQFHNASSEAVRMLCICSPAGQEKFFVEVGVRVATRTTPPPKLNENEQAAFIERVKAIAPKYRTELLREA